ncbi:MAG: S8 family serine peptidase, partial [Bacteroidota bacterium]
WPIKTSRDASVTLTHAAEGFTALWDFVQHHNDVRVVVNASLSLGWANPGVLATINNLVGDDHIVVAAAGNNGTLMDVWPAAWPNVIGVAAVEDSGRKATFSNYGAWVEFCAPGREVRSGAHCPGAAGLTNLSSYGDHTGTSFATPRVASIVAQLIRRAPIMDLAAVRTRLQNSSMNVDARPGNAAFAGNLGAGIVNAHRALTDRTGIAGATPFHNPTEQHDVNDDGVVTPLDALTLVTTINSIGTATPLYDLTSAILEWPTNVSAGFPSAGSTNGSFEPYIFFDVNGDNNITPTDILMVINHLNN